MKLKAFWGGGSLSFFLSFFRNFYTQTLGEGGQDIVLVFFLSAAVLSHTAGNSLPKIHSRY